MSRLDSIGDKIWQLAQPRLLRLRTAVALILLIHCAAAYFIFTLELNNAPELYVPKDSPAANLERELRGQFPNDEVLIGLFAGENLFSEPFVRGTDRIAAELGRHSLVDRVFSITTVDRVSGTEDGFSVEPLIDPDTLAEYTPEERRQRVLDDRFAPGLLVSEDGNVLAIVVRPKRLSTSGQRQAVEDAFHKAVKEARLDKQLVAVAGPVPLDAAEMRSMLQDTIMFTPLVVLLGLQLLLWVVGRFPPVLIGAVAISTTVTSAVAFISAIGQPYTLVTAMVPTLLAAYTVANLLHFYAALLRMRVAGYRRPRRVIYAIREVQKPAFFNVLTTIAGMLSLVLTPIPPVQVFGITGAFGALMIYLVVFFLVPPLLVRWDKGPWPRGGSGFAWTKRISYGLASFSMRHAGWVVGTLVVVFALMTPQIFKVEAESDLLKFFDDEHPLTRSTQVVERRLSGITSLEVIVDGAGRDALKNIETLRAIKSVQTWIEAQPEVDRTASMMDIVEEMNWAFHGEEKAFRRLPDNNKLLSQLLLIYDGRDLEEFINRDYSRMRIIVSANVHGANAIQAVMDKIRAHIDASGIEGLKWDIGGHDRLFSDAEDLLVVGQKQSFLGAFVQIFLILLLLWRSLPAALICLVPNLAPLFFVFVAMGFFGLYLDMATVLIASVVLGITVDDTIHFFHNYLIRRKKGLGVVHSLARSFEASGRAVIAISLLLIAQFMLLAGSRFNPTANYGLLTSTGLLAGQIFELLLLPALIVLWSKFAKGRRLRQL